MINQFIEKITSHPTVEQLVSQFNAMPTRDQQAAKLIVSLLAGLFVWFVVINPSINYKNNAIAERTYQQERQNDIREVGAVLLANKSTNFINKTPSTDQITSVVGRAAVNFGVTLVKREPNGTNKVSIWGEKQAFDNSIKLIADLEQNQGLSLLNANINRSGEEGAANFKLQFERK